MWNDEIFSGRKHHPRCFRRLASEKNINAISTWPIETLLAANENYVKSGSNFHFSLLKSRMYEINFNIFHTFPLNMLRVCCVFRASHGFCVHPASWCYRSGQRSDGSSAAVGLGFMRSSADFISAWRRYQGVRGRYQGVRICSVRHRRLGAEGRPGTSCCKALNRNSCPFVF